MCWLCEKYTERPTGFRAMKEAMADAASALTGVTKHETRDHVMDFVEWAMGSDEEKQEDQELGKAWETYHRGS